MAFFYDPSIDRKSEIIDNSLTTSGEAIPIPSVIDLSPSGTCNRSCAFCPRSNPNFENIKQFIEPKLLDKLSSQLGAVGFSGIFLFSGFAEPLLDKQIFGKIKLVKDNLPNGRVEMVTNGDVLNLNTIDKLFGHGLDTLLISAYDDKEQSDHFKELCRSAGLKDNQWVVRDRFLSPDRNFGITLTNRAGLMTDAEFVINSPKEPLNQPCYYPHYTFFMDYEGDVLLCPHDWGKKKIVGNMYKQDFQDIWLCDDYMEARKMLAKGNRFFSPCNLCDAEGVLMGGKHVEAWEKFEKTRET